MKTFSLSFMMLCAFFIRAQAQTETGNIKGKVVDSEGLAFHGATVNVKGYALGASTDENGVYELINISVGHVTLLIANVGHESFEKAVTVEAVTTANAGNASLKDLALDHHEVTVEGRRSYKIDDVSPTLRLQTSILEVPQNIQVINSQVLTDQQIFDMMDGVTRNVSGAVKQEHWENYALIYVRVSQINPFRKRNEYSDAMRPFGGRHVHGRQNRICKRTSQIHDGKRRPCRSVQHRDKETYRQ
ncbi:MAG: carboxypeptidase-like regulatory domain-containing protein [Cytophagaceae bacterium]|nr:carboxypeptidase-like regulatory domain-containing protein [Cytophagaceae bacterium]